MLFASTTIALGVKPDGIIHRHNIYTQKRPPPSPPRRNYTQASFSEFDTSQIGGM